MLLDMGKLELTEQYLLLSLSSSPEIQSSLGQICISLSRIEELRRQNDMMCAHWLKHATEVLENSHNDEPLQKASFQSI